MTPVRRLNLTAIHNIRDLGGYPVPGGVTRFGAYLRSEAPVGLPPQELDALLSYGVRTCIDLRSDQEKKARPSQLMFCTDYHDLALFNKSAVFRTLPDEHFNWGEKYIQMMENGREWLCKVLHVCAQARPGTVLFHCTTGKDRTGVITCCLLSIAGADPADIAADYCVSQLYLRHIYRGICDAALDLGQGDYPGITMDSPLFRTPASAMETLIGYLEEHYGGAAAYLTAIGVPEADMAAIRARLVDADPA